MGCAAQIKRLLQFPEYLNPRDRRIINYLCSDLLEAVAYGGHTCEMCPGRVNTRDAWIVLYDRGEDEKQDAYEPWQLTTLCSELCVHRLLRQPNAMDLFLGVVHQPKYAGAK